ncbi:MAG: 1,4-dihydroxy-2-naphthoate octaprenyltransferase [Syntrophales bacterium]|nr:1,4-dihydroxy-2-naphthoate octaprenyltransferase [Syntrophales bacterium]
MTISRDKLQAWIQASRPPFYIATLIPLTIGWILAGRIGDWHPWRFLIINLGAFMVHLATNLANDYFDHIQGADAGASIGGSRVIQQGKISSRELLRAIVALYTGAILIGLFLMEAFDVWAIFPLLVFSFLSSLFYVAPPIRYGYHGLGEFFVGINMGPIMVVGTYWVIHGQPDWLPLFISLPVALMVAAILYYQSLPDIETDRAIGKRTLAVRLGRNGAITGLIVFWMVIYGSITILVLDGMLAWPALAALLSMPLLIKLIRLVKATPHLAGLDNYGKYVRILYAFNGIVLIFSILFE